MENKKLFTFYKKLFIIKSLQQKKEENQMGNMELLREFINRSGVSLTNIARQLNITYVALNNKLKGKYAFTLDEALLLKHILNLTQSEWNAVFDEE